MDKVRKRKSAPESAPLAKKPKMSETDGAATVHELKSALKKSSKTNSDDARPTVSTPNVKSASKERKTKKIKDAQIASNDTHKSKSKSATGGVSKRARSDKVHTSAVENDDEDEEGEDAEENMAALLAGFGSSDEDEDEDGEGDADTDTGLALDKLPSLPAGGKELKKQLLASQTTDDDTTPGVLYIGRIPHGFYEHQMRAYFSQFGPVTRLRLARNKKSGKPKHHAWIEFASAAVADIVAKTMDKYLMFGHILQVQRVPDAQVHPDLWKGAGKRYKAVPRNKLEGGQLRRGATREVWERRVVVEAARRKKRAVAMREMGYEFSGPELSRPDVVPVARRVESSAEAEEVVNTSTAVKRKKASKGGADKAKKPRLSV